MMAIHSPLLGGEADAVDGAHGGGAFAVDFGDVDQLDEGLDIIRLSE